MFSSSSYSSPPPPPPPCPLPLIMKRPLEGVRPRSLRLKRPSYHPLRFLLQAHVLYWWPCLLRRYLAASDIHCHPLTPTLAPGAHLAPAVVLSAIVASRLPLLVPVSRRRSHFLQQYPDASDRVRPVTSRPKLSRFKKNLPWFLVPLITMS